MRFIDVGGEHLSVIGVGTWQFGSRDWAYGDEYASSTAIDIVHRALDLGVNVLDTAEVYGFGNSERIVGRAVAGRRDEAWVASKLMPIVPPGAGFIESRGRKSLSRLGIDVIDLYQVHWPNPALPKRTLADGLRRLVETNVVRRVGVSNYRGPAGRRSSASSGRRSCRTRCSTASPCASPSRSSCRSRKPTTA